MEDRPLNSGGAYNINWDEIDENSDPFGNKTNIKSIPKPPKPAPPPRSPAKVSSAGDGSEQRMPTSENSPTGSANQPQITQSSVKAKVTKPTTAMVAPSSPAKPEVAESQAGVEPAKVAEQPKSNEPSSVPISNKPSDPPTKSNEADPATPKQARVLNRSNKKNVSNDKEIKKSNAESDEFPKPSPHSGPSPEQLAKALESVALNSPNSGDREESTSNSANDSSAGFTADVSNDASVKAEPASLSRIDSSTRPASPAHTSALWNRGNMDAEPSQSNGIGVTEDEIAALKKERDELVTTIDEMRRCITEYDRSLQHLLQEKSQNQTQVNVSVADLISERDQAVEEVATIEKAFGDLHRRFEKSKQVIESFKQNEEALKRSIEEYKSLLQRQENKYLALKKLAEDKLLKAAQDAEAQRQEFESNATRLQAALRIAELQTKSLETQLTQKTRENEELTKICDELLSKYGGLT